MNQHQLAEEFEVECVLEREMNPDEHAAEMNALRDFENSYE